MKKIPQRNKIRVKVFAKSKKEEIIEKSKNSFDIKIKEKPMLGLANEAIIRAFAVYFDVPERKIKIIKGFKQRNKIIITKP